MNRALALFLTLLWCGHGFAQDVIALSVPKSGRFAVLGQELEFGAQMAIEDEVKRGRERPELRIIDDACDAERVSADVAALREAGVRIVVGAPCFAPAYALVRGLNVGVERRVPVVSLGIRHVEAAKPVEEGLPFFVLGPDADAEADAIASLVLGEWRDKPFALLDDGSVQARALTDRLREKSDLIGLRPVQNVTYRPLQSNQIALLRRLARSGVRAIFVAGEPEDIATISFDADRMNFDLEVAAGEAAELSPLIEDAPPVAAGTLAVFRDRPTEQPSAKLLLELLSSRNVPESDALVLGYAIAQIAMDASASAEALATQTFETVIGPVAFGSDQRADVLPFRLRRWDGEAFQTVEK